MKGSYQSSYAKRMNPSHINSNRTVFPSVSGERSSSATATSSSTYGTRTHDISSWLRIWVEWILRSVFRRHRIVPNGARRLRFVLPNVSNRWCYGQSAESASRRRRHSSHSLFANAVAGRCERFCGRLGRRTSGCWETFRRCPSILSASTILWIRRSGNAAGG